jgi:hypothetical protein
VDRFNTLFLEIRQLQTTLVHQLALPALLALLRYEELFVWGTTPNAETTDADGWVRTPSGSWVDVLKNVRDIHRDSAAIARCWIARFPHPRDADRAPTQDESTEDESLDDHLKGTLSEPWRESGKLAELAGEIIGSAGRRGFLTAELRRLYQILTALQILKQNLLREKITLVFYGMRAFGQLTTPYGADDRENGHLHLLMASIAVRYQLSHRVISLRNLQRQIEQIVDPAFDQDPRPIA